jgi:hypothetical protein
MAELCRDLWTRDTGTGQQVAQLYGRYMMMMMMMMMMRMMRMIFNLGHGRRLCSQGNSPRYKLNRG